MAWQFAGSLAAVAFLIVLAWRLGFAGAPLLDDEEHARGLAHETSGGFEAIAVTLDSSRHAALLRDAAGRIVLVAPAGAHFVARLLGPGTRVTREGGRLTLNVTGAPTSLELGAQADDWADAIAALQ